MPDPPWFIAGLLFAAISALAYAVCRRHWVRLSLNEERYRQIVETAQEGIAIFDSKGVCTMANEEFARINGVSVPEVLQKHFEELVDEAALAQIRRRFEEEKKGRSGRYELTLRTSRGVRYLAVTDRPVPSRGGTFDGTLVTMIDITAHRMAEQSIRESELNYRMLFDESPNPRMLVDRQSFQFYYVNQAAIEFYGYSNEEFKKLTMLDLQAPSMTDAAHLLTHSPFPSPMMRQHKKKDGTIVDVEVYAHDQDFEGRPCRQILAIDKTEQARAAKKVKESEQILALAQEIAHIGSYQIRAATSPAGPPHRRWSAELYRMLGVDPLTATPADLDLRKYLHPSDLPLLEAVRKQLLEEGYSPPADIRVVRSDGAVRYVRNTSRSIDDDPGHVIGTMQDVTEYRALQQQLEQSQRLDSIGRLASGVAHDFNNLLTVINGYSKLILKKMEPGTRLYHDIQQIAEAGQEAAALTKRLLTFGRKQVLKPVTVDLNEAIRDALSLLTRVAGEDVRIVTHLSAAPVFVRADLVQINQLLLNLSTNARDAMPRGGTLAIGTGHVFLDEHFVETHPGSQPGAHIRLVVADTGLGMDEATQRRIFEPFFTTKDRTGGTGLGLATVYGIVKQSGGSIQLESEAGKGSTFRIFLPAVAAPTADPAAALAAPLNDWDRHEGGNKLIVLVEDQPEVRHFIAGILMDHGYRVLQAANAKEGLAVFEELHGDPDLLLTDVVMPGITGFELVQRITALRPGRGVRVLFMSGYAEGKLDLPKGVALLEKPFSPEDLLSRIASTLAGPATTASSV